MKPQAGASFPVQASLPSAASSPAFPGEWKPVGLHTLCRRRRVSLTPPFPGEFQPSLGILLPDIAGRPLFPEDLLFFDVETTGLSGGAGTVAFLAGFGRLGGGGTSLVITQYLLLDYPGERPFIEALLEEFAPAREPPVLVTYNGKTFDSQILRTRCLFLGLAPPAFLPCDLLHPARRLWRRGLPDCRQSTVETRILGLDRSGDLGGALAPDRWFQFLRSQETPGLLEVCEHNLRDILGLQGLFTAFCRIAASPLEAPYPCDTEALALRWYRAFRRGLGEEEETARELLQRAALEGSPRCCRTLAIWAERGAFRLAERQALHPGERQVHHPGERLKEALGWTEKALAGERRKALQEDLHRRRERLLRKIRKNA